MTSTTSTTSATLTPYACAKIVNDELKTQGVAKQLPPQMFYTYVKKGYIKSTDKKVALVDLQVWFVAYLAKLQGTKASTPIEVEEIVADNDGTVGEWTDSNDNDI
jgi:hypothetical protein